MKGKKQSSNDWCTAKESCTSRNILTDHFLFHCSSRKRLEAIITATDKKLEIHREVISKIQQQSTVKKWSFSCFEDVSLENGINNGCFERTLIRIDKARRSSQSGSELFYSLLLQVKGWTLLVLVLSRRKSVFSSCRCQSRALRKCGWWQNCCARGRR